MHIAGALAFLAVHGVAAAVALALLPERRPERIRAAAPGHRGGRDGGDPAILWLMVYKPF